MLLMRLLQIDFFPAGKIIQFQSSFKEVLGRFYVDVLKTGYR